MKPYYFSITDGVYETKFNVCIGANAKAANKWLQDLKIHDTRTNKIMEITHDNWGGYCVQLESNTILIMVHESVGIEDLASTVSHECLHAVLYVFDRKGVVVEVNNSEPTAYYLGYLTGLVFNQALKYYNRREALKNRKKNVKR